MRSRALTEAVFWIPLVLAGVLIAFWPPHTVDGPAHVLGAVVLVDWDVTPAFREYYERDLTPTPNLGGSLVLAALIQVFGPRGGETVLLIACAVGLPLGLRLAVRVVRPEHGWAAVAALPFGFGYLYFYGFYGFCLGLIGFLVCVALAVRAVAAPSVKRSVALTVALTATWFTHLVPFALAIGTLGLLALSTDRRPRALAVAAAPMLPGVVLTATYLVRTSQGDGPQWHNPAGLLVGLLSLHSPLVALRQAENAVAAAVALLVVGVAVATRRAGREVPAEHRASVRGLGLATGAAVVVYLAAPNNLGIDFGLINERLALFPVLLGLLWLLVRPIPPRAVAAVAAGCVLAAGALLALRAPELRRIDRLADEYASAEALLLPGRTLLALRVTEFTPDAGRNRNADPVRHLSSLLAARTDGIDVGHYEAVLDYFPARFRDPQLRRGFDPDRRLLPEVPPLRLLDGAFPADGQFGHVLLVGAAAARDPDAVRAVARIRERLRPGYVRVGVTAPTGLVEVWRARAR